MNFDLLYIYIFIYNYTVAEACKGYQNTAVIILRRL